MSDGSWRFEGSQSREEAEEAADHFDTGGSSISAVIEDADHASRPDAEAATAVACVAIAHSILVPVDPTLTRPITLDEQKSDLDVIADRGPDDVGEDAQAVLDGLPWLNGFDPYGGDVPTADQQLAAVDVLDGLEGLIAWAATACVLDGLSWACAAPVRFNPAGTTIGPDPSASDQIRSLTPEGALTGDPDASIEVSRADHWAYFAWTDASGLVVTAETVVASSDGTWRSADEVSCP